MFLYHFAEQRIDRGNRIYFFSPELNAKCLILITWIDLNDVTADAKSAALKIDVRAFILQLHQSLQQRLTLDARSRFEEKQHAVVSIWIAEAIDTRDAGHYNHIAPLKQGTRRRHSQAIDLLVNDRLLLDIDVAGWHVGFGLVVIVVRNKIFDRIFRKERLEFLVELRRERLIVGKNQRGALSLLNDAGNSESLSTAGYAEQDLVFEAIV